MDKTVIEYLVPIQSDKDVSEYNAMLREFCGKGNFTPCKTTDEHVEILINQLAEAIQKSATIMTGILVTALKLRLN